MPLNAERTQSFPWGRLALAMLLTALLRLPSMDMPLDRDEGEYATLALAWMRGWGVPYRDYLEQKPPLAILGYMAAFLSGGESAGAVRAFAVYWQMLSTAALFCLALRLGKSANAALGAAILFACLSVSGFTQGFSANTELFVSLPMILAVAALSYGRERSHWITAGVLVGVAGLAKQSALPAALMLPILTRGDWRERARQAGFCTAGAALPWLACTGAMALADGAWAFWRCTFSYNLAYAGQGFKAQLFNLGAAAYTLGKEDWALWIALGFAAHAAFKGRIPGSRAAWIWLAAMALGAALSGRYYPHYFQTLAAPMSLLAALWAVSSGAGRRAAILLSLFALTFAVKNAPLWAAGSGEARSLRLYGLANFARAPRTAEIIRSRSPEGSAILIWGSEAEIYFLSRRRPATRFLFHYPFTGEAPPWPGGEEEILQAMQDPLTSAVVVLAPLDPSNPFHRKFSALLQRHYEQRVDLARDTLIGLRKQ